MKILVCLRCGNGQDEEKPWIQRRKDPPKFCWKCKSPYWNQPKGLAEKSQSEKPAPSSPSGDKV